MLSQQRAVVTGGSDGIGLSIAKAFAQNGAHLMLVARDAEKLKAATATLASWQVDVHVVSAALADPGDVTRAAQVILDRWPALGILVNNAGTARFLPFVETDEAALDLHLNLNVNAPYLLTRQLFGALAAWQGTVINISSSFAHRMLPGRPSTAYSLSKEAMDGFTKALALEAGPQGVCVNAIAPGTVNTPLVQAFRARMDAEAQSQYAAMVKTIYPLGRLGEPDDVAGAAVFLASDHARWMTGAIMAVNGGLTTN